MSDMPQAVSPDRGSAVSARVIRRRLVPAAIGVPFVLGCLSLAGERAGWYEAQLGFAFFAVSNIALFAVLIGWSAWLLRRVEHAANRPDTTIRESEEHFRTMVETMPNAVVAINSEGQIVLVNRLVATIFGYARDELIGQPLGVLLPERFRSQHATYRATYFEQPNPRPMGQGRDLAGRRKDGSEFPVEIGLSFMHTRSGPLALAFITDITVRKRAEQELADLLRREKTARAEAEAARRRFSFLAEASAVLASPLDYRAMLEHVVQLAVPAIADWCAVDMLDEDGRFERLAVSHIQPEKAAKAHDLLRRYPANPDAPIGLYHVVQTGEPELYAELSDDVVDVFAVDAEHRRLIKELAIESLMIVPLTVREQTFGTLTFVQTQPGGAYDADDLMMASELAQRAALSFDNALLYDAAQQVNAELEQRVRDRTAQLEAANRELEAFSYSVSHDLRAPLRAVDGFSLALLEDYRDIIDDEGKKYLELLRTESQRMGQLIDALLALSRYSRAEITHESVDLSRTVQMIADELQRQDPQRQVEVIIAPDISSTADVELIRTVLRNLLANAWKYTSKQSQARIEFGARANGGQREYFVRDNGVGFNMAYVRKLFAPFQRLHTTREFEGTGIGLATVQRIVHRHGGTVRAEGAVGEGATFYFTLGSATTGQAATGADPPRDDSSDDSTG